MRQVHIQLIERRQYSDCGEFGIVDDITDEELMAFLSATPIGEAHPNYHDYMDATDYDKTEFNFDYENNWDEPQWLVKRDANGQIVIANVEDEETLIEKELK